MKTNNQRIKMLKQRRRHLESYLQGRGSQNTRRDDLNRKEAEALDWAIPLLEAVVNKMEDRG